MKNLKFYSILGLFALLVFSACEKDEPNEDSGTGSGDNESPVLILSEATLTVFGNGKIYSVDYQVENPVEGATVSVDLGDVTWITNVVVTNSTINLTIEANSEEESRTATLTVSYPGAEDVSLTVVQEVIQYDYERTLEDFLGYIYYGYGSNGETLYYLWLSDIGFDNDGYTQAGGHYYNLGLLVEGRLGETLPTGTYTYARGSGGNYVISEGYSKYVEQYLPAGYTWIYIDNGTITISADGDNYTIEGMIIDRYDQVHRIYYNGPAELKLLSMKDVEFEATTAAASYYTGDTEVMNVELMFTNMEYNSSTGTATPPGIFMTLDTYMPYDADGKIATGTYTVAASNVAYTIYQYPYGETLNIYNYETTSDYTLGTITSGTMTVEAGSQDDYYNISCEFKTEADATVKCTYSGYLVVDDMPGAASTLTEDVTLDLERAVGVAYDYADYYYNGGKNWYIYIDPANGVGDGLILDINSTSGDTIPTATYTASTTTTPEVGEYAYGYLYGIWYMGTWYIQYDSNGSYAQQAPAVDGDIKFTDNGDGTHTIEFACKDDAGYTWSGTWTGTFTTLSGYSASTSATSLGNRSAAISKLSRQEISAKAAEMMSAKETKMKIVSPESRTGAVSAQDLPRLETETATYKSNK